MLQWQQWSHPRTSVSYQNPLSSSEPGKSMRLATAPVAMMSVSAVTSFSSVISLKGRLERSTCHTFSTRISSPAAGVFTVTVQLLPTLFTVSEKTWVPKRSLCFFMRSTSSVPRTPGEGSHEPCTQ